MVRDGQGGQGLSEVVPRLPTDRSVGYRFPFLAPAESVIVDETGNSEAHQSAIAYERPPDEQVNWVSSIPFLAVHVVAVLGTIIFGMFIVMVWGRIWFITAGYHRYFAHRSFKTSRAFQLFLAIGGVMCVQKGPLWWAGHHREHHRTGDTEDDVHSPLKGFWWSHVGWILCDKFTEPPLERIKDFAKFPELRFIEKWNGTFAWLTALLCFLIGGWSGLFFGFFMGTVALWHNTFLVNSVAHVFGRRRYVTDDTSRNNFLIALTTHGEGWHNNHHHYQASARNGFFWWEIDLTFQSLRVLSWLRIVRDLKVPTKKMLVSDRIADGNFDVGMYRAKIARWNHVPIDV